MNRLLASIALFVVILLPTPALAAGGLVPCDGPDCDICSIVSLAHNGLNFLILAATLIATILFAYAGYEMLVNADNSGAISKAKGIFTDVLIGFVILLASWLIIDTVMRVLFTDSQLGAGRPWQDILCSYRSQPPLTPPPTTTTTTTAGGGSGVVGGAGGGAALNQEVAEHLLSSQNIGISSTDNCSDPKIPTCTSLEGMLMGTINGVIFLSSQVCGPAGGCVLVTGGTETGHAEGDGCTHSSGCKIDIHPNPAVDAYIENFESIGNRAGDNAPQYRDICGNVYAREDDHWDISFSSGRVARGGTCQ